MSTDGYRPENTERLVFETWTSLGLDPLCQSGRGFELALDLWSNADVTRFLMRQPLSAEQVSARLLTETDNLKTRGFQYWPLVLRDTGEFVGCCGLKLTPLDGYEPREQMEMGFHLMPSFWGRGLALEAATAVVRFAFATLAAQRLFAGHHPENERSRSLLVKLGFHPLEPSYYPPTGLFHPFYVCDNPASEALPS